MDEREITKLAEEAFQVYKEIKSGEKKLNVIKDKIIEISKGKNTSYKIQLLGATIRVIKLKTDFSVKLKSKRSISELDKEIRKELLKNEIVKVAYRLNSRAYQEFDNRDLIPEALKDLVVKSNKKPFSVSFILDKQTKENL